MKQRLLFTLILILAVFVIGNVAVQHFTRGANLDMTAEKLYTLSDGTKTVLKELKKPVTLKFFYTRDLANGIPAIQSYADRVEGVLHRYENLSGGKIDLQIVNPVPFSEEEDEAMDMGVQAVPLNARGENLYFGVLAIVDLDDGTQDFKALKFFDPGRAAFLEQDLTKLIYDLTKVGKSTVGLLSSFRMQTQDYIDVPVVPGIDDERWTITNQIHYNYDIEYLDKDMTAVPDDVDILMLVHPTELSKNALAAVDRFIADGGKALILLDPYSERGASDNKVSHLESVLSKWRIRMPEGEIVADRNQGVRVQFHSFDTRLSAIDKLNWPAVSGAQMNKDDAITRDLSIVRLASPGHFVIDDENVGWEPLLTSTDEAMTVTSDQIEKPEKVLEDFKPTGEIYTYAARLGDKIILVADSDLVRDEFWVRKRNFHGGLLVSQVADNGAFIINALDRLSGSQELINLRSRNPVARPFTVVAKLRRAAEQRFLVEEKQLQEKLTTLQDDLKQAEKINDMAQADLVDQYRADILQTRKALRSVQHDLRKEIEGLGTVLKALNIGGMPLLIFLMAFFLPRRLGIKRR